MGVVAIHHVQLAMPPGREDEARAFYGGLLGLSERPKPPRLRARGGCWFEHGAVKIHLGVEEGFAPARKAHPAFVVDDFPALLAALERAGCRVVEDLQFDGCERRYVDDPFGNRIELMQPTA